jgi:RsiW-degrading membrane proteinase PrsW (M82 family)
VSTTLPDPDKTRRQVGLGMLVVSSLFGLVLLLIFVLLPPLASDNPMHAYGSMLLGATLALPAGLVYLLIPRTFDRYDPEPWYALVGCLMWGGICAAAFSIPINTCVMSLGSEALGAVVSAPFVEEFWKGIGIVGVFYFLHREFDGIVDGIIYATFIALAFAITENVIYYARGAEQGMGMLAVTVFFRGIMSPWLHPLFTAMTGMGFGIARETKLGWVKFLAPIGGYCVAVLLHMTWNGSATLSASTDGGAKWLFFILYPGWILLVIGFFISLFFLVKRRGRILREYLLDEVALGTITQSELDLVCAPFGRLRAHRRHGLAGANFVSAIARLSLSKWHVSRAYATNTRTLSWDFIVPLRQEIAHLRRTLRD